MDKNPVLKAGFFLSGFFPAHPKKAVPTKRLPYEQAPGSNVQLKPARLWSSSLNTPMVFISGVSSEIFIQ